MERERGRVPIAGVGRVELEAAREHDSGKRAVVRLASRLWETRCCMSTLTVSGKEDIELGDRSVDKDSAEVPAGQSQAQSLAPHGRRAVAPRRS